MNSAAERLLARGITTIVKSNPLKAVDYFVDGLSAEGRAQELVVAKARAGYFPSNPTIAVYQEPTKDQMEGKEMVVDVPTGVLERWDDPFYVALFILDQISTKRIPGLGPIVVDQFNKLDAVIDQVENDIPDFFPFPELTVSQHVSKIGDLVGITVLTGNLLQGYRLEPLAKAFFGIAIPTRATALIFAGITNSFAQEWMRNNEQFFVNQAGLAAGGAPGVRTAAPSDAEQFLRNQGADLDNIPLRNRAARPQTVNIGRGRVVRP